MKKIRKVLATKKQCFLGGMTLFSLVFIVFHVLESSGSCSCTSRRLVSCWKKSLAPVVGASRPGTRRPGFERTQSFVFHSCLPR